MKKNSVPPELFEKLKKKLNRSQRTIYNKIQDKVTEYNGTISTRIGSFLVAKDLNVNFTKYLTDKDKDELRKANSFIQQVIQGKPKIIERKVTKSLKPLKGISSINQFLPSSLIDDAKEMAEKAYPFLYIFENSVRNVIKILLEQQYGPNWWDIRIKQQHNYIDKNVLNRMKEEKQDRWALSKRGEDKIYYTDLDDLRKIIVDNWAVFKKIHKRQSWVIEHLMQLKYSRNIIAHNNSLKARDITSIQTKIQEWFDQIKDLKV